MATRGPPDEGQRDRQALLLAAGQLPIGDVLLVGETEVFEQLRHVRRRVIEGGEQVERLAHLMRSGSSLSCSCTPTRVRRRRGRGAGLGRGR